MRKLLRDMSKINSQPLSTPRIILLCVVHEMQQLIVLVTDAVNERVVAVAAWILHYCHGGHRQRLNIG